jgi:hypothetical protein
MPLPFSIGMAATESLHRSSFATDHHLTTKPMPILTTTAASSELHDPMDITPTSASMPPPNTNNNSPQSDKESERKMNGADSDIPSQDEMTSSQPTGAAAAANQPTKVVQTAFIHKLYK